MEVLADALALVDDGQPAILLVQAGVLDGDRRVAGERLDDHLVLGRELGGTRLVGQVQVADGPALHRDRDAEEAVHRRVVRREAVAPRVDRDVRDPEGLVLVDDQAQEPVAAGQGSDLALVASLMPEVMNRSITPRSSTVPRAA